MSGWQDNTGWSTTSSSVSRQSAVDHIFGVDGANIEDLYDAAHFRVRTSPRCWPSTSFPRPRWPTGTAAAAPVWVWWRRHPAAGALNLVAGPWGVVGQPGSGAGAGRSAADDDGRSRQLSGHQRPQRLAGRRGVVFRGVGLCRRVLTPDGIVRALRCGDRGGADAVDPQCCCCPRIFSRLWSASPAPAMTCVTQRPRPHRRSAADRAGAAPCPRAGHDHRRRAGGPRRRPRPNSSSCGRCCARGWPRVPDAKDVSGRPARRRRRSG